MPSRSFRYRGFGLTVEVLHGALQATKANGQPDWPIRVRAARLLATLPPEEVEPEPDGRCGMSGPVRLRPTAGAGRSTGRSRRRRGSAIP